MKLVLALPDALERLGSKSIRLAANMCLRLPSFAILLGLVTFVNDWVIAQSLNLDLPPYALAHFRTDYGTALNAYLGTLSLAIAARSEGVALLAGKSTQMLTFWPNDSTQTGNLKDWLNKVNECLQVKI